MTGRDALGKIIAPFLTHGIYKDEAEVLEALARDYVRRHIDRYAARAAQFRSLYGTAVDRFGERVRALCAGTGDIAALADLPRPEQIVRAEDDLEEWEAAERFLARWQGVQKDLEHAAAA